MTHLAGNALAGLFADTLGIELTAAIGRCGICHRIFELARAHAFVTAIGAVLRCEHCQGMLAVIVQKPHDVLANLSGLAPIVSVGVQWRVYGVANRRGRRVQELRWSRTYAPT